MYDNHIDVYSTNKELLLGIMELFKLKFSEIKISELKRNQSKKEHHYDKYYFYVLAESREKYLELIGFDHKDKLNDLIFNIKRIEHRKIKPYVDNVKELIINYLQKENLSAKQLSRKLMLSHGHTLDYVNGLKQEDKIKIIEKGHFNENIWSLNLHSS